MEFDDCVHRIYVIGSQEQEELSSRFRQLSFEVGKNGITGFHLGKAALRMECPFH